MRDRYRHAAWPLLEKIVQDPRWPERLVLRPVFFAGLSRYSQPHAVGLVDRVNICRPRMKSFQMQDVLLASLYRERLDVSPGYGLLAQGETLSDLDYRGWKFSTSVAAALVARAFGWNKVYKTLPPLRRLTAQERRQVAMRELAAMEKR